MNDLAMRNIPKLYDDRRRPIYPSLEESKEVVKDWMKKYYDFRTKLEEKLENVDNCETLAKLQEYAYNSCLYGVGLKVKNERGKWGY